MRTVSQNIKPKYKNKERSTACKDTKKTKIIIFLWRLKKISGIFAAGLEAE